MSEKTIWICDTCKITSEQYNGAWVMITRKWKPPVHFHTDQCRDAWLEDNGLLLQSDGRVIDDPADYEVPSDGGMSRAEIRASGK